MSRFLILLVSFGIAAPVCPLVCGAEANLALGKPVKASAALYGNFAAENLVDGKMETFTHPAAGAGGEGFSFEIDLGSVSNLGEIRLHNRQDGCCPERLSQLEVQVLEAQDGVPVWKAMVRADGSNSGSQGVDKLSAKEDAKGKFSGRFIRLINRSKQEYSPQLAEVEVLGVRDPNAPPPKPKWGEISGRDESGCMELTVAEWPEKGKLALPTPFVNFSSAILIEGAQRIPLTWEFNPDATVLVLFLPEKAPAAMPAKIALEAVEDSGPKKDGRYIFSAKDAVLNGTKVQKEFHPGNHRVGFWVKAADFVSWERKDVPAGSYDVELTYSAAGGDGTQLSAVLGAERLVIERPPTGSYYHYRAIPMGRVTLGEGSLKVEVRCEKLTGGAAMNFKALTLRPATGEPAVVPVVPGKITGGTKTILFNRDVRPILSDKCFACHGPDAATVKGGLRLDSHGALLKGGESGAAVNLVDVDKSEIILRTTAADIDDHMPPKASEKASLTAGEVAILKQWIREGAEYEGHWAFSNPERPVVPTVPTGGNEIDAFILKRLQEVGLQPSPEADKRTLIRRVTLDLTGLPPTAEEVNAFVADASPNAYEKIVDRLLASPHYGEMMAMPWLDHARFADSNGFQADFSRQMWPWRDWLIEAFNRNLPFDQFTIEQLAGDMLPNATQDQIVASGFNRNHRLNGEGGLIAAEWFVENVIDRVETTASTWMGLTMNCCRCHDHKYDPVTQKEFYGMFAYFNSVQESGILDKESQNTDPIISFATTEQKAELVAAQTALKAAEAELKKVQKAEKGEKESAEVAKAKAAAEEAKKRKAAAQLLNQTTMVMKELPKPKDAFVLNRGEYDKPGERVERMLPAFLPPLPPGEENNRLGYARWLVSGDHPLTARVWVNRAWEKFFGHGICKTTENFGSQADWPSHLELLDWLATEFVRLKWDMKAMQKLLVMSAAYRQTAKVTPELLEKDPENRLLARGPRFRLLGELLRDQALAVSGLLQKKIGGPSVRPYMPEGIWDETTRYGDLRNYQHEKGEGLYRRTIYTIWKRTAGPPTLQLFDAPTRDVCTIKRGKSNTPLQALALLNEVTFVEAARAFAQRILASGGATPEARFQWAMQQLLCRPATAQELEILTNGLAARVEQFQKSPDEAAKLLKFGESPASALTPELAAYTMMANVLLNMDEATTRE